MCAIPTCGIPVCGIAVCGVAMGGCAIRPKGGCLVAALLAFRAHRALLLAHIVRSYPRTS
jgi:hypothetical protein